MALSVFTNVGSLNAQRNLSNNSKALDTTLARLSSGLRINSASDDAAGLAISTGLQSQLRGLNQAIRNAGDGLSLLGTAESAIGEQTNLLQRVRELAVQAASDTNSASNRNSLNSEVTALKSELDRIATTISFNGLNLLDGTFTSKEIQVGANSGASQRITVDLQSSRAASLGSLFTTGTPSGAVTTGTALTGADGALTITIGGVTTNVGASVADGVSTASATSSALAFANAINSAGTQVEATATGATGEGAAAQTAKTVAGDATDFVKINGVNVGAFTTTSDTSNEAIDAINAVSGQTGVTATRTSTDKITLSNTSGANIEVATGGTGTSGTGISSGTLAGTVEFSSNTAFTLGGTQVALLNQSSTTATKTTDTVQTLSIATKDDANNAIKTIDAALTQLNERRAGIGAQVNRLNSTISSLSAISENVSASNSRILDADFAAETAALTRTQILQQAATAVLAQANQTPQLALSLLR